MKPAAKAVAREVGYVGGVLLCLVWSCSQPSSPRIPDASSEQTSPIPIPAKAAATPKKAGKGGKAAPAQAAPKTPAPEAASASGPATEKVAEDDLKTEEPEENPYTENVTLRLAVTPQAKALVMWGGKQMAKLAPGAMEAEIVRPRGSGPVDLEIKAEGYMPYHTRLYSDRNEKVSVRLYRPEEAPGLFGFKRAHDPTTKKP